MVNTHDVQSVLVQLPSVTKGILYYYEMSTTSLVAAVYKVKGHYKRK